MTNAIKKRSRNKCESCRKLRIKCDEVKHTCEYCLSTNRECVYNEVVKRKYVRKKKDVNDQVIKNYKFVYSYLIEKSNGLLSQRYQGSLNSIIKQLNLTQFEGQLLFYFHGVYLMSTISKAPCQKMWLTEIPSMWHESEWLRKCVFSTSIMFIGNSSNLEKHIHDSYDIETDLVSSKSIPRKDNHLDKIIPYLHESINKDGYLEITNTYFLSALNHSRNEVSKLVLGININSEYQFAENYFTAVLLYLTLILHPRKLFPVLASDDCDLDLILICQDIKILMEASFPLLYSNQVKYSTIFAFPRLDPYALYLNHYPLIDDLRITLSLYTNEISDNELEHIRMHWMSSKLLFIRW